MTDTIRAAAQHLALDLGWPVLPVRPNGKEPLSPHGVKDATTDERTILQWWNRWDDFNLAVATGAPGPQVLDIDDPAKAGFQMTLLARDHPPETATARGRHMFFAGTEQGTITLDYGELRGRGSYVVVPPSIHPSGKEYTWLTEPRLPLPAVPGLLAVSRQSAGAGERPVRDRVGHGERHAHLQDLAVRLVRSGLTDAASIERALRAEYEEVCDKEPPAKATEFSSLAKWATESNIAKRERARGTATPAVVDTPMSHTELASLVMRYGGFIADLTGVVRHGRRPVDALELHFADGNLVYFERQGDITIRGAWERHVIYGAAGRPPKLSGEQLADLSWALVKLSGEQATAHTEADELHDALHEFLGLCEPIAGHHAQDSAGRFALIAALRLRATWDPSDRASMTQPALVIDARTQERYVRAGDLWAWLRHRGFGISGSAFPGRMRMIGLVQMRLYGREPLRESGVRRATNTAAFYRLPQDDYGVPQDA